MTSTMTIIAAMVSQKPKGECNPGIDSKFMPKIPVIRVNGINIAVMVVNVRMISLVR